MAIIEVVIIDEEIPCISFVVEVRTQPGHHLLDVIAFIDDFISIILFAVILAHVGIVETVDVFLSQSSVYVKRHS